MYVAQELVENTKKYLEFKNKYLIKKYRAYIEYCKSAISAIFDKNKKEILSYFSEDLILNNETIAKKDYFLIDFCMGDIHYDGIQLGPNATNDELIILNFVAHDSYYDPLLKPDETDDYIILNFFEREFKHFLSIFNSENIVQDFIRGFNNVLFNTYKSLFTKMGIEDICESNYAFKLSDSEICDLNITIWNEYDKYRKINESALEDFEKSVKNLK